LSECDLDTRDIDRIIRSLVDSLEASFHSRITYPWQQGQAGAGASPAKPPPPKP
jgi:membrane-associated HD superfamily phosphohydrolase